MSELPLNEANVTIWQQGLSQSLNDTYSYAQNSVFYGLLPIYYQDYYQRYVKRAVCWLDGYVPSIHQSGMSGIVSTRLGNRLIAGLTKQIVGERMIFRENSVESNHDDLHYACEFAEKSNLIKPIYASVGFALGVGTSLLKLNVKANGEPWWEAVRLDQCFFKTSYSGEIEEVFCYINSYADTSSKEVNHFTLVEHRYYKTFTKFDNLIDNNLNIVHKVGERQAMVEYVVYRSNGQMQSNVNASVFSKGIPWEQLPKFVRDTILREYSAFRINEPMKLPFLDLGVVALQNGNIDLGVPTGSSFGESMLVGIQDDLITYELASSYLIRDMYLGKGTVYVPKAMSINSVLGDSPLDNIGDQKIEKIEGLDPDKNGITVQQFNVRAVEWQTIKENALKNIGVKWGMSPKILASFLANGQGQMTATQIDSEDDNCIAFIYHVRAYFKSAINKLLKTTLNYLGRECRVEIGFASPSLINKDRILNRVKSELDAGLITIEEAVREMNPDFDEEAIQKKIELVKKNREELAFEKVEEMNDNGDFVL